MAKTLLMQVSLKFMFDIRILAISQNMMVISMVKQVNLECATVDVINRNLVILKIEKGLRKNSDKHA